MFASDPKFFAPSQVLADVLVEELDLAPPVPIEDLVRAEAMLVFGDFSAYPDLDALMQGLHDNQGQPTVLVNRSMPPRRIRFTLGHEFGHLSIPSHVGTIRCHPDEEAPASTGNRLSREMEGEADAFASRLLVPQRFVQSLDLDDSEAMLNQVQQADVSAEAGIIALASRLPPGYAFAVLKSNTNVVERWSSSYRSMTLGLVKDTPLNQTLIGELAEAHGIVHHQDRRVWWARTQTAMRLTSTSEDWASLLDQILDDLDLADDDRRALRHSASSVAGAANSTYGLEGPEFLAQRIRHRLQFRDNTRPLTRHPIFDDFVTARVNAFIRVRARREKSG